MTVVKEEVDENAEIEFAVLTLEENLAESFVTYLELSVCKIKEFPEDLRHLKFCIFDYSTAVNCIVAREFWGCKPNLNPN